MSLAQIKAFPYCQKESIIITRVFILNFLFEVLVMKITISFASDIIGYVHLSHVARKLGSRHLLVNAIKNEHCAYRTRRFGTRGLVYETPQAEPNRIIQGQTEWVSKANARLLAHVSAAVLRKVMELLLNGLNLGGLVRLAGLGRLAFASAQVELPFRQIFLSSTMSFIGSLSV
ncbi:hypothetical protein LQ564_00080 [Massilia sp. G4R7]|uniref:Uncharacterized protein n=1 Tax=Massilia phyllostachyos TaxID=2898585 RepID=A0ABS8PYW1_9BURK|nr:hypothetical protein [Massilia phyllostachyos]MCD2514706.1 hypothetical protein [Massilia phyllostachyos]